MTDTPSSPAGQYGVYSEVGRLRKVLVCAPGLAHERLTPTNCDDLLFDDVLWVQNARRDHFDFVSKMRDRGVEVIELHNLLTETLANPEAVRLRPGVRGARGRTGPAEAGRERDRASVRLAGRRRAQRGRPVQSDGQRGCHRGHQPGAR